MAALEALGYKPTKSIGKPQPLIGYQGDYRLATDPEEHTTNLSKALKADIIIPRKQVGDMSNDIGFRRDANGVFHAIISDYDSTKHNTKWLGNLKYNYAQQNVLRAVARSGGKVIGTPKVNAKGKLEYKVIVLVTA